MKHVSEYQYKTLEPTSDPFVYNGQLYVMPADLSKNVLTSPVNKLTATNHTETSDESVIGNTLSGNAGTLKFNLNFKLHSDLLAQAGDKLVFKFEGLLECKVHAGKLLFLFPWLKNMWYAISSSELTSGWNNISLSADGVKLSFIINNTVHTLIDSSKIRLVTTVSNFSGNNYIRFNRDTVAYDVFEMICAVNINNSGYPNPFLSANNYNGYIGVTAELKPGIMYGPDGGWKLSESSVMTNTMYWYKYIETASGCTLYLANDDGYSIDSVPDESWVQQVNRPDIRLFNNTYNFRIGENRDTGAYLRGTVLDMKITVDEIETFNLATAEEGSALGQYQKEGSVVVEKAFVGPQYPTITVGDLTKYQTILYLKDIQATLLED